ncbi:hypothetical protein CPT_Mater200 [Bacillus phage Mater]|uniref:Uncharacterized protein n=1 Tax=Bacillus phage Mater TaxID=1540090 RepID=A0A0A0RMY6_9CAUD|nr:hypothetical protein CPT_Mater200 [Bacillus phage Mater]AIW03357.1 hypothetical protein CPT_Mater200 [Bacillus phage Mater]
MTLEKGNNKSTRHSEAISKDLIKEYTEDKAPTLTDLITRTATEEEYEEVAGLLVRLAKRAYEEYKFLIYKTTNELDMPHLLQIVSNWAEAPTLHKEIFKKAIDYGINMDKLRMLFAEKVRTGKVLDLGEGAVVVVDDNTGNPTTGVSNINSGLEGGEITFIVSFISKENFKAWYDKHFPAKEEEQANE